MRSKLSEGRLNRPAVRNSERKGAKECRDFHPRCNNMLSGEGPTAERPDLEWTCFLQNAYCWKARVRGSC